MRGIFWADLFACRLAFLLLPSGGQVKTKNPPPSGSGFLINSGECSKPVCRAGQQRVRKQQVQVVIHVQSIHRQSLRSSLANKCCSHGLHQVASSVVLGGNALFEIVESSAPF